MSRFPRIDSGSWPGLSSCWRWTKVIGKTWNTYHRKFAITKPHDPSGSLCSSASSGHPPGDDASRPPRETAQFPPHQLANAKASAILCMPHRPHHTLHKAYLFCPSCFHLYYRITSYYFIHIKQYVLSNIYGRKSYLNRLNQKWWQELINSILNSLPK